MRAIFICLLGLLLSASANAGTFFNPAGSPAIAEKGAVASACLNDALASLHLMYAAMERKDVQTFRRHRDAASRLLGLAYTRFKAVEKLVPNRTIEVNTASLAGADDELVKHFLNDTLADYNIAQPKTLRELVGVSVRLIEILKASVDKFEVNPDSMEREPGHELIRRQLESANKAGLATTIIFSVARVDSN